MMNEFNEFDDFDELDNLDSNLSAQNNYYYDEESSFDGTLNDYDYLDYDYNAPGRGEDNDYYNEEIIDDEDDEYNDKSSYRNKIIKFIIILIMIILAIWIITLITKNSNKKYDDNSEVKVIKTNTLDNEEMFLKTKTAALKYFSEERVEDSINQEKTIKLLKSLGYIDTSSDSYDLEQSNIKLTENSDKYNLIITLVYDDNKKSRTYEISNYSYCIDSYLCEEQEILEMDEENQDIQNTTDDVTEENSKSIKEEIKLSKWSLWSNYERASCDTQRITCNSNDNNCLTEVKTYERKEKVGTHNKIYNNTRFAFSTNIAENINVCKSYDYIKIDGVYYRTDKNSYYKVLGGIKKDTKSNYYNWRYDGRNSYTTPPSDTITTRYVYVEPDYSSCTNTCKNNPKYYYDKYTFTKQLVTSINPSTDCSNLTSQVIANYSISKQNINISRVEDLYGTVCYKSTRTRKLIKE